MTTHELLELASLDALGLLDDDERQAFERGFQSAPPALQAQIRREQARLARADAMLPDVEAPASLRARVLAAVREAIQTVGSGRRDAGRVVPPLMMPSRGVSPIWRAAAIGAAAAAIVFGFATLRIRTEVERINDLISANAQDAEWVREFGPRFRDTLYDPDTRFVQFAAADASSPDEAGQAVIMIDGEGNALLLSRDLPDSSYGYALVPVQPDGSLGAPLLVFDTTPGARFNERVPNMSVAMSGGTGLAIVAQTRTGISADNTVLRSKAS